MERKDRGEKWIILLRQRGVRAEPGMSMQTGLQMWIHHLLNYFVHSVVTHCLDIQLGVIQGTYCTILSFIYCSTVYSNRFYLFFC